MITEIVIPLDDPRRKFPCEHKLFFGDKRDRFNYICGKFCIDKCFNFVKFDAIKCTIHCNRKIETEKEGL